MRVRVEFADGSVAEGEQGSISLGPYVTVGRTRVIYNKTDRVIVIPGPEPTKLAAVVKLNDEYFVRVGDMWSNGRTRVYWDTVMGYGQRLSADAEIIFEGIDV